jgi:hypothetical protein
LRSANLSDAFLGSANLSDAFLLGANLSDANLESANLTDAYLRDANLSNADLRSADLSNAYLRDANLRDAKIREETIFKEKTVLPDAQEKQDEAGNYFYDKYWTPDTDMTRYTDPDHPDFWEPDWVKEQREQDEAE